MQVISLRDTVPIGTRGTEWSRSAFDHLEHLKEGVFLEHLDPASDGFSAAHYGGDIGSPAKNMRRSESTSGLQRGGASAWPRATDFSALATHSNPRRLSRSVWWTS